MRSLIPYPTAKSYRRQLRANGVLCLVGGVALLIAGWNGGSLLLICAGVIALECWWFFRLAAQR